MNNKKTYGPILSYFSKITVIAVVTSCININSTKKDVCFSVNSTFNVSKTEYSGEAGEGRERIDWKQGDRIRVACAQVSEPESKWADYSVSSDSDVSASGEISTAKVSAVSDVLKWGSGSHTFYAVYPSPASSLSSDSFEGGVLLGEIPSIQKPFEIIAGDAATAKADLRNEYMVARTVAQARSIGSDGVLLSFTPITTAIQFTLQNALENNADLKIKKIRLISEKSDLSGRFKADLNSWSGSYPACTAEGANSKSVTLEFTSTQTVGFGKTLQLTLFMLPVQEIVDDLVFQIEREDGSVLSTSLKKQDGTGVEFARCKKKNINGVLVREGIKWTVNFSDNTVVSPWNEKGEQIDM